MSFAACRPSGSSFLLDSAHADRFGPSSRTTSNSRYIDVWTLCIVCVEPRSFGSSTSDMTVSGWVPFWVRAAFSARLMPKGSSDPRMLRRVVSTTPHNKSHENESQATDQQSRETELCKHADSRQQLGPTRTTRKQGNRVTARRATQTDKSAGQRMETVSQKHDTTWMVAAIAITTQVVGTKTTARSSADFDVGI